MDKAHNIRRYALSNDFIIGRCRSGGGPSCRIIGTDISHVIHFTRILNKASDPDHIAGGRVTAAGTSLPRSLLYAIHPIETLYSLMGAGCDEVTRIVGGDFATGSESSSAAGKTAAWERRVIPRSRRLSIPSSEVSMRQ